MFLWTDLEAQGLSITSECNGEFWVFFFLAVAFTLSKE